MIDPPWPYRNSQTRNAAGKQYSMMSGPEISELPINKIAGPQAHLYLWVTAVHLQRGLELIDHWGFEFKTPLVYVKRHLGMGNWWRMNHEMVLFGVRGKLRPKRIMEWTTFSDQWYGPRPKDDVRGGARPPHSTKPELFYDLVEQASPGPYLDMFARRHRPGWTVWGTGVPKRRLVRIPSIDTDAVSMSMPY